MTDSLQFTALGGTNTLTVYGDYPTGLYDQSIALVAAYEKLLSFYDAHSLLGQINANAGVAPVKIPIRPVFNLIAEATAWSKRQLGFNAVIGPLVNLWRIGFADAHVPQPNEIEAALALTDPDQVILDAEAQTVLLAKKGMSLDLGGIAKGFILDELKVLWTKLGVTGGRIDLAGNTLLFGNSEAGYPLWQVPISDPRDDHKPALATLTTEPKAVVTTGIFYRQFAANGRVYHHLLDPVTGYPVESPMASITVIADSALSADVLSSIGFYAGVPAGYDLIEDEGADAVFITKETQVYKTSRLRETLVMTMGN